MYLFVSYVIPEKLTTIKMVTVLVFLFVFVYGLVFFGGCFFGG